MKNINPLGMFDEHFLLEKLTKLKDPLVKLEAHIDWKIFSPILDVVFHKPQNCSNAGRPPFDRILMFKILILQSLYNLSDDQIEYQITDRLTFKRFLGLKSSDRVPDSKTIWKFRETLIQEEVIAALFYRFNQALDDQCIFAKTGQIVDASFVEAPRQRNTREENKEIKAGKTPEAWKEKPNKLRQKDVDARWVKKNKMLFYGYKNHVKTDSGTKLITTYAVTDASVHDSQELETLIDRDDAGQKLYADSAYIGQDESIDWCGMTSEVHEKGARNHALTDEQKASNHLKSKSRARVEHLFGFITNSMDAMHVRTIGIFRAAAKIGLTNLTYNMMRCVQLKKKVYAVFIYDQYSKVMG
jgi:transposase, IS5 family